MMAAAGTSLLDLVWAPRESQQEGQMHERWLILAVLTFARTAMGFQFQSVAAVSPFLLDQFQMSYAALGTLVGLYLLPVSRSLYPAVCWHSALATNASSASVWRL